MNAWIFRGGTALRAAPSSTGLSRGSFGRTRRRCAGLASRYSSSIASRNRAESAEKGAVDGRLRQPAAQQLVLHGKQ